MRYYVEWWHSAIETWMGPDKYFWFERSARRYAGKRIVKGHCTARKWRVINDKTNKVIMTVERIDGEG